MKDFLEEVYRNGLDEEIERFRSDGATENVVSFYHSHKKICDEAYEYFKGYDQNINKYVISLQKIPSEQFISLLKEVKILTITANPIERAVFLRWLSERNGKPLYTYRIGKLVCNICHIDENKTIVHVSAGKTGEEYTRKAINRACRVFNPEYICLVGICYGLNMAKYSLGSVFVSESLKTFRLNFRDELKSDEVTFEAEDEYSEHPSDELIQIIRDRIMYTQMYNILSEDKTPESVNAKLGRFLSCNSIMSSRKVKHAVLEQYSNKGSELLGGEMEGAGILKSYIVEEEKFKKWLIIKSVCDWGEKKNALDPDPKISEHIKDSLQAYAMTNTCGVFEMLMEDWA